MKIRTRLTLLFTLLAASVLLIYASAIYWSARENREKEFYDILAKEAITKANLFLNAKVPTPILHDIYLNNREILNEVEVALFDINFNLLYHDAVEIDVVKETPELLEKIAKEGNVSFYQNEWQILGLRYELNGQNYIVTAAAVDQYGYNKLNNLLFNSVLIFLLSMGLIYGLGWFFSKKAFRPVQEITDKARQISASQLSLRLKVPDNRDELSELSTTINRMLERLEHSFEAQKHFVSHISHELRTPLSAMITELELSLNKERDSSEYKNAISRTLEDAKKLARLSRSLLDLAKADYDQSEISFKPLRLDEIVMEAISELQQSNSEYSIILNIDPVLEHDEALSILGNEYLLKVAFFNLMENACRFSEPPLCKVTLSGRPGQPQLIFEDQGIGIPEEDLPLLGTPFFRGANHNHVSGNGIGLSLTQKIIALHGGSITYHSVVHQGTSITIVLNQKWTF